MSWQRYLGIGLVIFGFIAASFAALPVGQAGSNVDWMKQDILKFKESPVTVKPSEDTLILSDSPELVKRDGIMYQDTVKGDVRLFFHHVNDTSEPKKIVVLLINEGNEDTKIDVADYGLGGPGTDYMKVGKHAQNDYFNPKWKTSFTISPKKNALLDVKLNFIKVEPGCLLNGIYDFSATNPVKVAVVMMPIDSEPITGYNDSIILPADKERLRGTFKGKDRLLILSKNYDSSKDGFRVITLADNKVDKFSFGIDAIDGSKTQNYGNYGVMYRLYLPSYLDSKFSVYLNPRGGVYAGHVRVKYRQTWEETIATPTGKLFFGENTSNDFSHLGDYEGGHSLWMTFSPPGASNLPVKIVIVPLDKKK